MARDFKKHLTAKIAKGLAKFAKKFFAFLA